MLHQSNAQKWGNSIGIHIPVPIARKLHLHAGTPITIEVDDERIIIQSPKYHLDSMLKEITPKNRHHDLLLDDTYKREMKNGSLYSQKRGRCLA